MKAQTGRRTALRWLVLGGLAAAASRIGYLRVAQSNLLGNANAMEVAEELGASYLADHPEDGNLDSLCQAVLSTNLASVEALPSETVRDRVIATARADYQAGNVLELREWCLSRSEARLCALVYLLSNTKPPTG